VISWRDEISWRDDLPAAARDGATVVALSLREDHLAPTPRDLQEAPSRDPARGAFLRRRALSRRIVAARLGVAPQSVEIGHGPSGAPRVLAPSSSLKISVSGRADFCAVAMAESPIGVDIEPSRAIEPPWSLLHPNERNILETLTGEARADAFLRLWTAKEAYLKALGLGFARDPTKIAIGLDFSILDEEAAPTILTRGWRRFVLRGEDFIAACVVLG
jgi:4'-phosphopantetheinyl transferase